MKIALLTPKWGGRRRWLTFWRGRTWVFDTIMNDFKRFAKQHRPDYEFDIIRSREITKSLEKYDWILSPIKFQHTYDNSFFKLKIRNKFIAWVSGLECYDRINDWSIFKYVFVQSESIVREKALSRTTYFIQPNGVDTELFKPMNLEKEWFTGFVGNPKPSKKRKRIGWYDTICRKANVTYHIHDGWRNPIPRSKLPILYNRFKTYMCTSIWEGGPLPLLEAASCGLPLLSTPVGFAKMLIKNNGFVCKTIQEFVEAIEYLKNNEDEMKLMGKESRRIILEDWDWRKRAKEWITRIEQLG